MPRKRNYIIIVQDADEYSDNTATYVEKARGHWRDWGRAERVTFPSDDNILEDLLCQAERDRLKKEKKDA